MKKIIKKELKKEKFSSRVKQISKEAKNINKLKKDRKVAKTPEEKEKLTNYIDILTKKRDMILGSITEDDAASATLAQKAKAFRVLSDRKDVAGSKEGNNPKKGTTMIGNINILNMNTEDLLEFLSKKSQKYDKN